MNRASLAGTALSLLAPIVSWAGPRAQSCVGPPTGLGTVVELTRGVPIPGKLPNTTADVLRIDCDGVASVGVTLMISEPPTGVPLRGTIVFSTGALGTAFYGWELFGLPLLQRLQPLGFRLVDRAWTPGWFNTGGSIKKQSCRYGTLLKWIHDNYHTTGSFVAIGSSGGSAEIGYALTTWGAGDLLDVAIITGGPPMARLDLQCPEPPPPGWLALCAQLIPPNVLQCGQPECSGVSKLFNVCISCTPNPSVQELLDDSILHPAAVLHYPKTRTHLIMGGLDCLDTVPSGMLFFNAVTSEKILEFVPWTQHLVVQNPQGLDAVVRAVVGGVACQSVPAAMSARAWPRLGGTLDFDVSGPSGGNYFLLVSTVPTAFEVPPYGWLFLANPLLRGAGTLSAATTPGTGTFTINVPVIPSLVGFEVFYQALSGTCLTNLVRFQFLP